MIYSLTILKDFLVEEHGTASVEFALIAPVVVAAVLSVADIGFAIHERAEMDHALRNGAERAVSDPGVPYVETIVNAVYKNGSGGSDVIFSVNRFCACPEASSVTTSCYELCSEDHPPSVYYKMTATGSYSGFLLPTQTLYRSSTVQTR